jgi:integrase/recombinase XerD
MTPRQRPAPPQDLAGRHLAKFFTDYLAGERAASPRTIGSYRDALKLLLTWFKIAERIPPEKLRLADIDRPRILRFLGWLETERGCSAATRNQRLAVIKSFCRYTAVEQPDRLDQVVHVLAIRQKNTPAPNLGHLTGDEVKTLLAEPGAASARAVRDTVVLALAYDTAARVQELCDLNVADIRRSTPMTVTIRGKGSTIRYLPVMDPTARLVTDYLAHLQPHPGLGADTDPLFHGPNHSRLTRSGVAKLLTRHVRAIRARDPGWAPGLPVTPHTLRRSRAMHLIQAGVNLIYIRDLLGHADIATTEIYARADAETKRKAIENAYQPLTPDILPDWTTDTSLIGWLDTLGR